MNTIQSCRPYFASSAYTTIDDEPALVGKYGRVIEMDDGTLDAWFIGPDFTPLHGRRIGVIQKSWPQGGRLNTLTGEAYGSGRGQNFLLKIAPILGIKKRRKVSAKTRKRLRQLSEIRTACNHLADSLDGQG